MGYFSVEHPHLWKSLCSWSPCLFSLRWAQTTFGTQVSTEGVTVQGSLPPVFLGVVSPAVSHTWRGKLLFLPVWFHLLLSGAPSFNLGKPSPTHSCSTCFGWRCPPPPSPGLGNQNISFPWIWLAKEWSVIHKGQKELCLRLLLWLWRRRCSLPWPASWDGDRKACCEWSQHEVKRRRDIIVVASASGLSANLSQAPPTGAT